MKIIKGSSIAALALSTVALSTLAPAAFAAGHYVTGVEGIQAASAPPPGLYYLGYVVNYNIDSVNGAPGDNTGTVSALANRFVWISDYTFLGANYGAEAIVPFQATSLTFNGIGFNDTSRGLGDIYLGPVVMAWHGSQWDGIFALGEWLDNGSYSKTNPSSVGLGYKSTMVTLGGTFYPDSQKQWSVTALSRFEKNGKQTQTEITRGNQLSVEWGVARQIGGGKQLGIVGYLQKQTSNDSGPGSNDLRPQKSAVGLEFDYPILSQGLFLKFAGYKEYSSRDGATKGSLLRMTVVKAF